MTTHLGCAEGGFGLGRLCRGRRLATQCPQALQGLLVRVYLLCALLQLRQLFLRPPRRPSALHPGASEHVGNYPTRPHLTSAGKLPRTVASSHVEGQLHSQAEPEPPIAEKWNLRPSQYPAVPRSPCAPSQPQTRLNSHLGGAKSSHKPQNGTYPKPL